MTKTTLIIGILKLGDQMGEAESVESSLVIQDMEILCDEFLESNKL